MNDIKINRNGIIKSGEYAGWKILIEPDNDYGFYIFIGKTEPKNGFDDYFDSYEILKQNFDYDVDWEDFSNQLEEDKSKRGYMKFLNNDVNLNIVIPKSDGLVIPVEIKSEKLNIELDLSILDFFNDKLFLYDTDSVMEIRIDFIDKITAKYCFDFPENNVEMKECEIVWNEIETKDLIESILNLNIYCLDCLRSLDLPLTIKRLEDNIMILKAKL